MEDCPNCKDEIAPIDIEDYVECPTCEGSGKVAAGTKGWIQNLMETKGKA